jgi:hypothetical protein
MAKTSLISFLIVVGALALLLGMVVITPYSFTAIPECHVLVTNSAGKPIDNAKVFESAAFLGLDGKWTESKTTDIEGKAAFEARRIRASLLQRAAMKLLTRQLHLPYGATAMVYVCDEGLKAAKDKRYWEASGAVHLVATPGRC